MYEPIHPVTNPTDKERRMILLSTLESVERPEDFEYIIKYLSPPPDITSILAVGGMRGVKIGIIGGGVAGMAAAFELRKLGADITILEASEDRIGGRIYTYYFDKSGKLYAEFGAMRIPVSHETTWHYINLFQLNTISAVPPVRNSFRYVHNTRMRITESVEQYLYPKYNLTQQERETPWNSIMDYAFDYQIRKLPPDIRAEIIQVLPTYSPEYLPFMDLSVRQYLENLGLSQGAISLMSGVSPMIGSILEASYDEIISDDYSLDYRHVYHMEGGSVNLPMAFYRSFHDRHPPQYAGIHPSALGSVSYKIGSCVTGIYQSAYRDKIIVRYANSKLAKETAEIYDYVICTLPYSALREVEIKPYFSNLKMQAIYEYHYNDALKAAFLCNRRFWERDTDYGNILGGISYTDLPIQSILYPIDHNHCTEDRICSSEEPGVLMASYNFNRDSVRLGNQEAYRRYQVIRENVEEVHGLPKGFLNTIVEATKTVEWNHEPNFRGGFALALPGQKRLFSYEMQKPEFNNCLFFAGEHLSAKHGWLQGALQTGMSAANQLASAYLEKI